MEKINYVETVPEYISTFIQNNSKNIQSIITEEKKNRGEGIIYINASLKENKMDVVYLTYQESKDTLHLSNEFLDGTIIDGKTTLIINDDEYKTRFILYI